jgi:outer membrane biosynthesis protein TonB
MLARVQSVSAAHEPSESEVAAPTAEPVPTPTPTPTPVVAEPATAPEPAEKPTVAEASSAAAAGPTVKALLEQLSIRGGHLNGTSLGAALDKTTYPRLTQCYEHALAQKPRVKGRLIVGFTVKANGHAANAKNIGGNLKDAALIRCSLEAVEATRFPKPRKQAAKITVPFQYRPS